MPATSKAQRRLFALALAVKRGEVPESDVDDKIKDLAKRSEQDLKDFAETPEETLPNKVEDNIEENNAMATPGSVNGMGAISMPGDPGTNETGSGDLAASSALTKGNPDKDGKKAKQIYKFLKYNAFVGESLNEANGKPQYFFFPIDARFSNRSRDFATMSLVPWIWDGSSGKAHDATDSRVISVYSDGDPIPKYQKKNGIPTTKEIEAYRFVDKEMWALKRKIPRDAFNKFGFYRYGNGQASDMGFVYSPKNGFEFYLNIPREIRHPEESSTVDAKDIQMFDKISNDIDDLAKKVKRKGFKTSVSSTPDGWKR